MRLKYIFILLVFLTIAKTSSAQASKGYCKIEMHVYWQEALKSSSSAASTNDGPKDVIVLSNDDILGYDTSSIPACCILKNRLDVFEKLRQLKIDIPLQGLPFVIKVDGNPILQGNFWTAISSFSPPEGVMIENFQNKKNEIRLLLFSYPKVDQRRSAPLLECLHNSNRLK